MAIVSIPLHVSFIASTRYVRRSKRGTSFKNCLQPPAGKIKLEFLEDPSLTLLGYSRISNLFQAHLWDFLEIACWYWRDLARTQATKLASGRISLNFKCEFQAFPTPWKSKLNVKSMELNPRKSKQPIPPSYFKKNSKKSLNYFSSRPLQ